MVNVFVLIHLVLFIAVIKLAKSAVKKINQPQLKRLVAEINFIDKVLIGVLIVVLISSTMYFAGGLCNRIAMAENGGKMPYDISVVPNKNIREALMMDHKFDPRHKVYNPNTDHCYFLIDRFYRPLDGNVAIWSIGDRLIFLSISIRTWIAWIFIAIAFPFLILMLAEFLLPLFRKNRN
ncbi:MAG: DUF5317 domain-containing protein [Patescibacteria group bacterium]|nr:DUF5317 domain-containing protein [Patescibacteria group bacterium]